MISKQQVDLKQGTTGTGHPFGYVAGEEGGFFFTWLDDLDGTLASVEVDEVDGDGDLDRDEVVEFLEEYLPTTRQGRELWGIKCPACQQWTPMCEVADAYSHNTGGEELCISCHKEVVAADSDLSCPGCK